jgi:hypothetical protein
MCAVGKTMARIMFLSSGNAKKNGEGSFGFMMRGDKKSGAPECATE